MRKFILLIVFFVSLAHFTSAQTLSEISEKNTNYAPPSKEINETLKRGIPSSVMVWDTQKLEKVGNSYVIKLQSKTGFTCFGVGWKSDKNIAANDFKITYKIVKNPTEPNKSKRVWGIFEKTEGYLNPSETATDYFWSDLLFGYDEESRQELLITITPPLKTGISEIRIDFMNLSNDIDPRHARNMMPDPTTRSCPAVPAIIPREDWCGTYTACTNATYTPTNITATHSVIHHGASPDTYTDGYAVVRSYWNYHVNTLGWSDIGYNYLIDKYGNLFQGRKNDNCPTQDVRGAHAGDSNSYSIGINFLGNADVTLPTTVQLNKLYDFLGWWYDYKSLDPTSSASILLQSGGTEVKPRICGHKDVNVGGTACPGVTLYALLPTIRTSTKAVIDACNITDTTAPTTSIADPGWVTTSGFTANFNDSDETGGSGLNNLLYQVADFDGTEWRSNSSFGFFNDNFPTEIHSDWTNIGGAWAVTNGVLTQSDEANSNTNLYASVNQVSGNTYMYNWKMKISGTGTNRRAGIHFFSDDATQSNRNNSYMVYFRADGNVAQIYEYTANTMYLVAEAACTIDAGTEYDYKVICDNSTGELSVYQDDTFICSWTDTTPLSTGNSISLRTGNCVVEYDDFKVFKSRTSTANITVGNGSAYEIRYQNTDASSSAGKIASYVTDLSQNISQESTVDVNVDYWGSYPVSVVNDGTGTDISTQTSLTEISANWPAASDVNNTIKAYWYAIGTTAGGTDISSWTSVSTALSVTKSDLTLSANETYYVSVKSENNAGLFSVTKTSNGVEVTPALESVVVFTETMGTVSSITSISSHEAADGFDNDMFTMTGTGDVRTTSASSGYENVSGAGNIYLTTTLGRYFEIEGINTVGYSNLVLTFGMYTNLIGYAVGLEVSTDGVTYTSLGVSNSTSGTWTYKTATGEIPATSNLRIRFTQPGSSSQFRIDDISLTGLSQSTSVESVSISPSILELSVGTTGTVMETVLPANAGDKSVTWVSSNSSVATVDASGVVTAVSEGTANITATSVDGSFVSNTCAVSVYIPENTSLVEWNFPDENDIADGGISENLTNTITSNATGSTSYSLGATTNSISKTGWHDGTNLKYWEINFTTSGYNNILLSSKQKSSNTGPTNFKLQYSLDGNTFTDVTDGSVIVKNDDFVNGVLAEIALPAACSNQTIVYVRWLVTSTTSVSGATVSSVGTSRIDDIIITGTSLSRENLSPVSISAAKDAFDYNIYPNPCKGTLNIEINSIEDKTQMLNIYDISGKTIYSKEIPMTNGECSINISHINKGLYFLRIGNKTKRLILE